MLCDRRKIFSENLFDTDRHGVYGLLTIQTILTLHNPSHAGPPHPARHYTHIYCLSPVAVVIVGKGRMAMGQSQIQRMVSNGKGWGDQTKTTKPFRTVGTGSGKVW